MKSKKGDTLNTVGHTGNTKVCVVKVPRQRGRSWCFTWNNYTAENIAQLTLTFCILGNNKYVFQEEVGKNNTKHLQGVVTFKNAISFRSLKKISEKIHWEKCNNLKASIRYCSKEETRAGKIYQHGIKQSELWHKKIVINREDMVADIRAQSIAMIPDMVWPVGFSLDCFSKKRN